MSVTAWLNLRYTQDTRARLFRDGLTRNGYKIQVGLPKSGFGEKDIFVTWNRIAHANKMASQFIKNGQKVLVTENATWGNDFNGERWYHISRTYHNTRGVYPLGGSDRFDDIQIELKTFRDKRDYPEEWILPSRGIGSKPVKMPKEWLPLTRKKHPSAKVRKHPGTRHSKPIIQELANAHFVHTWGSGAAVKCLMEGIKVKSHMPNWIGEQDNTDDGRYRMLCNLAWSQWRHREIKNGEAFEWLLQ